MTLLKIIDARSVGTLQVKLRFSDEREGRVDFSRLIGTDLPSVFDPLRDPDVFAHFELRHDTLHWRNELDLAPEYLYFRAFERDPTLRQQFVEWGYLQSETAHA